MNKIRLCLVAALVFACGSFASGADAAWQAGGNVMTNGKASGQFLKQGTHMVFPVVAIAQALGKAVTYDAASKTLSCGSVKFTPATVAVVDNVVYVGWRDLNRLIPGIEYGVNGNLAVFAVPTVHNMPAAGLSGAAQSMVAPVLVVNAKNPGQVVGPVTPYLVSGNYTIVEFFSEY